MTTIEKLAKVQQELIAPKNQFNKFGGYNYRSCEDILEGLKTCLSKVKAAVTITDDIVEIGGRHYVKATATFHDAESNGTISNTAFAREEETVKGMSSSQVTGSASSYARKYALNGLFAIDDVKDADSRDNREVKEEPKEAPKKAPEKPQTKKPEGMTGEEAAEQAKIEQMKISEVKIKIILQKCAESNVDTQKILMLYKVKSLADLTELKFRHICDHWDQIVSA